MSGKDLTSYLQPTTTTPDEFDLGALDGLDFDAIGERVTEMQKGGGEVLEPSNVCESGGCMI